MIELLTADTPNGKKISIMLEEIKFDYKVTKINILKDEQFKPEFKKLSPFSKIPVIIDHEANTSLFESFHNRINSLESNVQGIGYSYADEMSCMIEELLEFFKKKKY